MNSKNLTRVCELRTLDSGIGQGLIFLSHSLQPDGAVQTCTEITVCLLSAEAVEVRAVLARVYIQLVFHYQGRVTTHLGVQHRCTVALALYVCAPLSVYCDVSRQKRMRDEPAQGSGQHSGGQSA